MKFTFPYVLGEDKLFADGKEKCWMKSMGKAERAFSDTFPLKSVLKQAEGQTRVTV